MKKIYAIDLGSRDYLEVLKIQEKLEKRVIENKEIGYLLISENEPVITVGRSAGIDEILYSDIRLKQLGISKYNTDRGGRVTLHGPGQIVGYPILNLENYKKDLHWYLENLENVIGRVLSELNIDNFKLKGKTGVWTEKGKVCAIGVKVKKWVTTHGFALNHTIDLGLFDSINPCGLKEDGLAKVEEYDDRVKRDDLIKKIYEEFENRFNCKVIKKYTNDLHML